MKPTPGGYGSGQFIAIRAKDSRVSVQTPKMQCGGCYSWRFGDSGDAAPKRFLTVRVTDGFGNWIRSIESKILESAEENAAEWFGTAVDKDTIASWFCDTLKGDDLATMRLTVPFRGDECQAGLFNSKNELIECDDVPQTGDAVLLLDLEGLWFQNRRFGIRWKLNQAKFFPNEQQCAFVNDD